MPSPVDLPVAAAKMRNPRRNATTGAVEGLWATLLDLVHARRGSFDNLCW